MSDRESAYLEDRDEEKHIRYLIRLVEADELSDIESDLSEEDACMLI